MPEHVHLVVAPRDDQRLTPFLTALKRPLAKEVIARWRELNAPILFHLTGRNGSFHFWQAGGGYDRNVMGKELIEKIRYVHANPIQRGLSSSSTEWAWSSARQYADLPDAAGPAIAFELVPDHQGELI